MWGGVWIGFVFKKFGIVKVWDLWDWFKVGKFIRYKWEVMIGSGGLKGTNFWLFQI